MSWSLGKTFSTGKNGAMEVWKEGKHSNRRWSVIFWGFVCFFFVGPLWNPKLSFSKHLGEFILYPKNESKDPLSYSDKAGIMIFRFHPWSFFPKQIQEGIRKNGVDFSRFFVFKVVFRSFVYELREMWRALKVWFQGGRVELFSTAGAP